MKTKIVATFMALGMVLTAFSMLALAEDANPEPTGISETGLSRVSPNADGTRADTGANAPNGIAYMWEQGEAFVPTVSVAHFGVNSKGIVMDSVGTWTYNALYTQCAGDMGSVFDVWVTNENIVMVYEVFNDQSVTGRNYTMIFEDQFEGDTSTNFGANNAQNTITPINDPTLVSSNPGGNTCTITIANQVTGYETASLFDGYGVYKSTTGPITQSNQGTYLGDATLNAGTWDYIDSAFTANSYYAVKVKWDGSSTGTFIAPLYSYGMSNDLYVPYGVANDPPVVTDVNMSPDPHDGNTVNEFVTIFANVTDAQAADTLTAFYRVDGGAWVDFGTSGTTPEAFSAVYNFPSPFATGSHTVEVRANDTKVWSTVVSDTFFITDSTAPIAAYHASTPASGVSRYIGNTVTVTVTYEDFTNYSVANSRLEYRQQGNASWTTANWGITSFAYGSYLLSLSASFAVWGPAGTIIEYRGIVDDIGGGAAQTLGTRTVEAMEASGNVADPYPVYGWVYLYNGNAGVYAPVALNNAPVTITWWNTSGAGAWSSIATTSVAGQYSVDINNYTNGDVIFCNATAPAPYNNLGYNYTTVDITAGGSQQNIVCGVPYDIQVIAPTPLTGFVGTPFNVVYRIVDRNNVLCQGYYTFAADGPINMRDMGVAAFVPPADYTFNGIVSPTPGTRTDAFTYNTPGLNTFNVSEGGVAELNPYLTPWGAWTMYNGANGYLKDWSLWTINIVGGGFNWHFEDGWNLICVPAAPIGVLNGSNGVFDAFDALELIFAVSSDATLKLSIRNLATNPSTYTTLDYGMPEPGAGTGYDLDSVSGYWVFTTTAAAYDVNVLATNWTAGSNVFALAAGWNLVGFTHNMDTIPANANVGMEWTASPMAHHFTDATFGPGVPATNVKIVATWWNAVPQWYNSYVVSTTFPGMVAHDWTYATAYAYGYWVWVSAPTALTFNVNY